MSENMTSNVVDLQCEAAPHLIEQIVRELRHLGHPYAERKELVRHMGQMLSALARDGSVTVLAYPRRGVTTIKL
jgi:hypothetical protein